MLNEELIRPPQLYNSFPRLMGCLPGPHQTVQRIYQNITDFIREEMKEHKRSLNPSTPRDYIDYYLNKIEKVSNWSEVQLSSSILPSCDLVFGLILHTRC